MIKRSPLCSDCVTLIFMQNTCFCINSRALCMFAFSLLCKCECVWVVVVVVAVMHVCLCVHVAQALASSCQSLKLFTPCCCLREELQPPSSSSTAPHPPLSPRGWQPQLESRRSDWAMGNAPRGAVRWSSGHLGQTLLNALGWLRFDRLGQGRKGGGENVCVSVYQCRSLMTEQMEVVWFFNIRKSLVVVFLMWLQRGSAFTSFTCPSCSIQT